MSCCECGFDSPKHRFTCPECASNPNVGQSVFQVCNRECQKKFWKVHKKMSHVPQAKQRMFNSKTNQDNIHGLGGFSNIQITPVEDLLKAMSNNQSWFESMSMCGRAEAWLVDCDRMRVDDDCRWGGCNLHGLYSQCFDNDGQTSKAMAIVTDFLVFMKLAVVNKVIPQGFNFQKCLRKAAQLLNFAFEKSDAKDKWGGENVFSTRPSLRRTAELVYGSSCMVQSSYEANDAAAQQDAMEMAARRFLVDKTVCQDVGGQVIWKNLLRNL